MKKNRVWIIEGQCPSEEWVPVFSNFYRKRKAAVAEKPKTVATSFGIVKYRVTCYEAKESK